MNSHHQIAHRILDLIWTKARYVMQFGTLIKYKMPTSDDQSPWAVFNSWLMLLVLLLRNKQKQVKKSSGLPLRQVDSRSVIMSLRINRPSRKIAQKLGKLSPWWCGMTMKNTSLRTPWTSFGNAKGQWSTSVIIAMARVTTSSSQLRRWRPNTINWRCWAEETGLDRESKRQMSVVQWATVAN